MVRWLQKAIAIVIILLLIIGGMLVFELLETPVRASSLITTYIS